MYACMYVKMYVYNRFSNNKKQQNLVLALSNATRSAFEVLVFIVEKNAKCLLLN